MVNQDVPMTVSTNARNQPRMLSLRRRFALATLFATALAMCMVPVGCVASDEQAETPPQPAELSTSNRTLSPGTVDAILACTSEGVSRLSRHSYDILFEVQATELGAVRRVDPNGKRLDDAALEACLIRALEAMSVLDLLPADESLAPTSQSILPRSRSLLGNTALLPQVIRLAPIVITASGVTIVVAVVVVVAVVAIAGQMSEECQEEWKNAYDYCQDILESNDPPRGVTGDT